MDSNVRWSQASVFVASFVLGVACAHRPDVAPPVASPPPVRSPPPLPPEATNALARCVDNGFWCLDAALLAPPDSLEKACIDEVPGACVASTVARLERPAVDGEWTSLVRELDRWCAIGDAPACGLLELYRSDDGPPFLTHTHVASFRYARPDFARIHTPSDAASAARQVACRAGDPLACNPHPFKDGVPEWTSHFLDAVTDACDDGDLEACVQRALLHLLLKKPGVDVEAAARDACEAGLAWHCVGSGDAAIVSKTKRFQALCASGASAAACLPGDFEDDDRANCEGIHRACHTFACPKPLQERLLSCDRRLSPWPESDPVLARVHLATDELDCRKGTAEACVRAAKAHQTGVPGISADPRAAHTYGQLACRVHGDRASCAIPAPGPRASTPTSRRLVVTPFATGEVTLSPETIREARTLLDEALGPYAKRWNFEVVPDADVLATRAFDPLVPCDATCVRTLDRVLHPFAVIVPFALADVKTTAIAFRYFPLDPPAPSQPIGGDGPTPAELLADLADRLPSGLRRIDPGRLPPAPAAIPPDAPQHDAWLAHEVAEEIDGAFEELRRLDPHDERTGFWNERMTSQFRPARGNRFALFFDPARPLQDRSHRFDDMSGEHGGIAADTFAFPGAATPTAVVATRCPVTEGPVGHRGSSQDKGNSRAHDWLVLAVSNVDADDTLECWTLASFDRTDANGRTIRGGTPFQEQADVEPARVKLAARALTVNDDVAGTAAILGFPARRLPDSLDAVTAFAARVGRTLDPVRTCEGFRYERLADDRLRVTCEGLRRVRTYRVRWSETSVDVVPEDGGRATSFPRARVDALLQEVVPRGDGTSSPASKP